MTREVTWSPDSRHLAWLLDQPGHVPAAQLWTRLLRRRCPRQARRSQRLRSNPALLARWRQALRPLHRRHAPHCRPAPAHDPARGRCRRKNLRAAHRRRRSRHRAPHSGHSAHVYIYEYDWTPDSKSWAATAAHGSGDNNWWIARLYFIAAATGQMRELYQPQLQIADPHVSPDGKFVAFIQGLISDSVRPPGGDVYIVPLTGGDARNLTPGIKASPASLAWTAPDRIAIFAIVDGNSGHASLSPLPDFPKPLHGMAGPAKSSLAPPATAGPSAFSFSRDGSVTAVVRQSASEPPEIWAGPIGKWQQLTHVNDDIQPTWGDKVRTFTGSPTVPAETCTSKAGSCSPPTTTNPKSIRCSSACTAVRRRPACPNGPPAP